MVDLKARRSFITKADRPVLRNAEQQKVATFAAEHIEVRTEQTGNEHVCRGKLDMAICD